MNYSEAARFVLRFGKYAQQEIDRIAVTDEGLKYLDWLHGQEWLAHEVREALDVYFSDPAMRKELDKAYADSDEL